MWVVFADGSKLVPYMIQLCRGVTVRCQPKGWMTSELKEGLVGSGVGQRARGALGKIGVIGVGCI
jgi:hypothetical protein